MEELRKKTSKDVQALERAQDDKFKAFRAISDESTKNLRDGMQA